MSLHYRLLIAASLVLATFLGATGLILDQAFRESAETAVRERMQGHLYALMAVADVAADGALQMQKELPESRFATPYSGLYARIQEPLSATQPVIWQSRSLLDLELPSSVARQVGVLHFTRQMNNAGVPYFVVEMRVVWESGTGPRHEYLFQVYEDLDGYRAQVSSFRQALWGWLAAVSVVLLALQGTILRWSLTPLRKMSAELDQIRAGHAGRLGSRYPRELQGVSSSINAFIEHERSQRDRYRDALSDLAHSLKTPLAVIRGAMDKPTVKVDTREEIQEQVERMRQIVDHQLQRAAASGRAVLAAPVSVARVCGRLVTSLNKVYLDRSLRCETEVPQGVVFFGDEGDLMEVLGNVLDNACKWARSRVRIRARNLPGEAGRETGLELIIEDDGQGISDDARERVLQRGARADHSVAGHGIGLAVVQDILKVYQGSIRVDRSELGGAAIQLVFPSHIS